MKGRAAKVRRWKQRALCRRRWHRRQRRLNIALIKRQSQRWALQQANSLAPRRFVKDAGRPIHQLQCPQEINLSDAYEETIAFLAKVRRAAQQLNGQLHVDFTPCKDITPAGALLLVAEFDRWRRLLPINKRRLRPIGLLNWNPVVRRKLNQMGFFEILGTKCGITDDVPEDADRYIPFLAGDASQGALAKELRERIEELGPRLADGSALYDGLVEAMTNVKQHAYDVSQKVKLWWVSASVNVTKKRLTVTFLDHGLGIPATLPRSELWEQIRGLLRKVGADPFNDDAKLIEAAISVEKSRTNLDYRGNGLRQDIRGYIDSHVATGILRIYSRHGKCVYRRDAAHNESTVLSRLASPMRGTFLEWTIEEYASDDSANN